MKSVFKYLLNKDIVMLPAGHEILHIGIQNDLLYCWALVNPEEVRQVPALRIAGTGHPIELHHTNGKFWGTYMLSGGELVFHVFQIYSL